MGNRCDFSDLLVEQCACSHCRPDVKPSHRATSRAFDAKFAGKCAACGEWFPEDEPVCFSDDGVIHEACSV